jgi:hypothetical protein
MKHLLIEPAFDAQGQVLGHDSALDGLDTHVLQTLGEASQLSVVVQLSAVSQASRPRKDRRYKVKGQKSKSEHTAAHHPVTQRNLRAQMCENVLCLTVIILSIATLQTIL